MLEDSYTPKNVLLNAQKIPNISGLKIDKSFI